MSDEPRKLCRICGEQPAFADGVCRWESCEQEARDQAANATPTREQLRAELVTMTGLLAELLGHYPCANDTLARDARACELRARALTRAPAPPRAPVELPSDRPSAQLDAATRAHLTAWITSELEHCAPPYRLAMLDAMAAEYLRDPERYEHASWWACHDTVVDSDKAKWLPMSVA